VARPPRDRRCRAGARRGARRGGVRAPHLTRRRSAASYACLVGNLTRGPDGRWTALDGRHLYRQAKTAGCLYQAVLRRELTERLGLAWDPVEQGVADVRGVPRSVVEHFSQRRAEILEHMAAHGGRSAASAQIAALETRRAKQDVPVDRLRLDWAARAAEHGLTLDIGQRNDRDRGILNGQRGDRPRDRPRPPQGESRARQRPPDRARLRLPERRTPRPRLRADRLQGPGRDR